jgi:acylphosphatase
VDQLHVRVEGRVQGVGFRWFVRERARRLGLAGWVVNRPDGTVEVAASGDPQEVQMLRAALAKGPPGASVRALVDLPTEALDQLESPFAIKR